MNNEPATGKKHKQHQQHSNREIGKKGTQEQHSIYVIDLPEQNMKDEQLQEITKKYDKVIDQEKRKDSKGKRGNISIVTFSTKDLAEKTITGLNKANKNMLPKI